MSWSLPDANAPRRPVLAPSPLHSDVAASPGAARFANLDRVISDRAVRDLNDLYSAAVRAECSRTRLDWDNFPKLCALSARQEELRRSGSVQHTGQLALDMRTARQVLGVLVDRTHKCTEDHEPAVCPARHVPPQPPRVPGSAGIARAVGAATSARARAGPSALARY